MMIKCEKCGLEYEGNSAVKCIKCYDWTNDKVENKFIKFKPLSNEYAKEKLKKMSEMGLIETGGIVPVEDEKMIYTTEGIVHIINADEIRRIDKSFELLRDGKCVAVFLKSDVNKII